MLYSVNGLMLLHVYARDVSRFTLCQLYAFMGTWPAAQLRFDRLTADKPLRVTPDESERLFSRTPSPS